MHSESEDKLNYELEAGGVDLCRFPMTMKEIPSAANRYKPNVASLTGISRSQHVNFSRKWRSD